MTPDLCVVGIFQYIATVVPVITVRRAPIAGRYEVRQSSERAHGRHGEEMAREGEGEGRGGGLCWQDLHNIPAGNADTRETGTTGSCPGFPALTRPKKQDNDPSGG